MTEISFTSKQRKDLSGRIGEFKVGDSVLKTPKFFPIINIITGPTGVFRSGGVWKGIKIGLIKNAQIDAFMCQILHFLDYNISKNTLDRWLIKPIDERIYEEAKYRPIIFADSGGFKLLFTEGIDTSKFGFSPTPEKILDLQLKLGADLIATLDYPIPPGLSSYEVNERKKKSIDNAIETLEIIEKRGLSDKKFIFIPVHGYNFNSSYNYVKDVLDKIEQKNLSHINFGLAIGSLVPLKNSYTKIIDIVAGVIQSVRDHNKFNWEDIPIHAFGVSGFVMPILAIMGIDSFDSSGFAQMANNLTYMKEFGSKTINFYDLKEENINCECEYCKNFKTGFLERIQHIMKHGKPYKEHDLNGSSIKKYEIYAWIACHNYKIIDDTITDLRNKIENAESIPFLLDLYKSDKRMQQLLGHLTKYYDNLADSLLEFNLLRLTDKNISFGNVKWKNSIRTTPLHNVREIRSVPRVSLNHSSNDYDMLKRKYVPQGKKVLIITSCSKQKPYSSSKTVKSINTTLKNWEEQYELLIISGLYGPVPIADENDPAIIDYNYLLSSTNDKQLQLLSDRMIKFLDRYGESFDCIVTYITSKPYRILMENISKMNKRVVVLPKDLKQRSGKEFTKKKNLDQLASFMDEKSRQEDIL